MVTPVAARARLASVEGLGDLIDAMRGAAAARVGQARAALEGVDRMSETVTAAMAHALSLAPPAAVQRVPGRHLDIVLCTEQGFNGGLDDRVLDGLRRQDDGTVRLLLGTHGRRVALERGLRLDWSCPLISHAGVAIDASEQLHLELATRVLQHQARTVGLSHAMLEDGTRIVVQHERLLPLDLETFQAAGSTPYAPPAVHLPPTVLLTALGTEYVSVRLLRALLHAHASENLSRLRTMEAARTHIGHLATELQQQVRQQRQAAITEEVLELAAGLRVPRRGPGPVRDSAGGDA